MPSAAIFDLDGTLVDFHFDAPLAMRAMIAKMKEMGVDVSSISESDNTQVILDALIKQNRENSADVLEELYTILDYYEMQAATRVVLRESTDQMLQTLQYRGIALALVTNSGRRPAHHILRKHDIEKFFRVKVTRDDSPRLKPRGDGIVLAVSLLKVDPADAIYIGDSVYDIKAAREAGVMAAIVLGGVHSAERVIKEQPDFVISDLSAVPSLFEKLSR